MAKTLRIALAQFDFPVGAVRANAERIAALIAQAREIDPTNPELPSMQARLEQAGGG